MASGTGGRMLRVYWPSFRGEGRTRSGIRLGEGPTACWRQGERSSKIAREYGFKWLKVGPDDFLDVQGDGEADYGTLQELNSHICRMDRPTRWAIGLTVGKQRQRLANLKE